MYNYLNDNDKLEIWIAIILAIILAVTINYYDSPPEDEVSKPLEATKGLQISNEISNEAENIKPENGNDFILNPETDIEIDIEPEIVEYKITDEERNLIEQVVMGSAGHEDIVGQKAVAQCILNACIILNERPDYIIETLKYTKYRPSPSDEVKHSVSAVFDKGERIFGEGVIYFYNPSQTNCRWHETQKYVCTIGSHKFFEKP